ncbi:transmembrane protein 70 homolog, mitochondrial-like [Panonychus citri]|uniref:transmembrane protein 70 homolog, mitochondrial-like n=1 Tax=Panonychus citri TaxID=50023 RepID=UPI0023082F91|nr:transmembrane protein 70 homolog, mitochondrial-like [Panonychus citri]
MLSRLNKLNSITFPCSSIYKSSLITVRCSSSSLKSNPKIDSNLNGSRQQSTNDDESNRLIYEGPLIAKIKSVKLLSLTTSLCGFAGQTYIYNKSLQEGANISMVTLVFTSAVVLLFSLTPLLINSITKRYVYQLYFNQREKSFTAYTLNFLNRPVVTHFNQSTLQLAPVASPFTTIMVNKKPFFLDLKDIKDPDALELFTKETVD